MKTGLCRIFLTRCALAASLTYLVIRLERCGELGRSITVTQLLPISPTYAGAETARAWNNEQKRGLMLSSTDVLNWPSGQCCYAKSTSAKLKSSLMPIIIMKVMLLQRRKHFGACGALTRRKPVLQLVPWRDKRTCLDNHFASGAASEEKR